MRSIAVAPLVLTSLLPINSALAADPAPVEAAAAPAASSEEVVVTGLRGKPRTVLSSPAPIDVVSAKSLTETGKVGLKEILNNTIPSFNLPGVNGGGTSWTVRAYTLRGLNGDQALFLVNGKRRHTTALINNLARIGSGGVPVDLDMIPASAIQRIEVLRDGAAAQYGSDAIAGVVNIILKDGSDGGDISTSLGQYYKGDGATWEVSGDYGIPIDDGFLNFAINLKGNEKAPRNDPATIAHLYNLLPDGSPDPREATIDRSYFGQTYGPGQEKIYSGSYNGEQRISENATFYSFGTYAYRDSYKNTGSFLPSFINSLPEVYPNGFLPYRRIYDNDFQETAGIRGKLWDWSYDLSTSYAQDDADLRGDNTLNASLGPTSPRSFKLSEEIFDQWTTDLDLTRDLNIGLSHPLTLAVGAEQRWEQYQIKAGDPYSYALGNYVIPIDQPHGGQIPRPGLASYNGTAPSEAGEMDRTSYAGYVDASINLTDDWYVGLAGRYETYNQGVGDTVSGKFSTRWEFLPGYAIRGTISNGFRAPSLAQTIFASSTQSGTLNPDGSINRLALKVLPYYTPEAIALGATPLKPEKSVNYSVGFTAQPFDNFSLSVDAYQIHIDDRIVQTGILTGPVVASILQAAGFQPGLSVQYYTNAVNTRTQGIDIVADYHIDLDDLGSLSLSAAYTNDTTKITSFAPTPQVLANLGYTLFDRQKQADLTIGTPRDKFVLGANWQWNRWNVAAKATRYGKYSEYTTTLVLVDNVATYPLDRTYSPKWIADLDVSYDVTDTFNVAVGANNLFNTYPDAIGPVDPSYGTGKYGSFSPFGITGGYYYLRLTKSF